MFSGSRETGFFAEKVFSRMLSVTVEWFPLRKSFQIPAETVCGESVSGILIVTVEWFPLRRSFRIPDVFW